MRKSTAFLLALMFYASLLPWSPLPLWDANAEHNNYDVKNVTGDNTGRIKDMSIGSSGFTDNGYFGDVVTKGPLVDVRAFGAKGDDATNDVAAIQAAVNALPSTGGTVLLPAGTYKITAPIQLKSYVRLVGVSMGRSIIKNYADNDAILFNATTTCRFISIEHLQILDGLGIATRTQGNGIHANGTGDAAIFDINNVYIIGHYNGIDIKAGGYSTIRKVRVASTKNYGYSVTLSSVQTHFDDCYSTGAGSHGWYVADSYETVFNACASDGGGGDGYRFAYVSGGNTDVVMNGTSAESNTGNGYYLDRGVSYTMNSPRASNAGHDNGIVILGSRGVTVNSGYLASSAGYGVYIDTISATDPYRINLNGITYTGNSLGEVYDPLGASRSNDGRTEKVGTFAIPSADFTPVGTDNTSEKTLMSVTLPSGTMNTNNQAIKIVAWGTFGANTNNKTVKLYFGTDGNPGSDQVLFNSGAITDNGTKWTITARVGREDWAVQEGMAVFTHGATTDTQTAALTAWLTVRDQLIKVTGTGTSANDIIQRGLIVTFER